MRVQLDPNLAIGFFLSFVRASAWMVVCPPFNSNAIPLRVKVGLSAALALVLAPTLGAQPALFALPAFLAALAYQVLVGLALGFVVYVVFAVVQAAGELIDFQAGFSAATLYDPFTNAASTPIGRLYQLLAIAILFAINGHLFLVQGFMLSFEAAPLGGLRIDEIGRVLTADLGRFLTAALQISAPLLAALFLTEIVLGLLTRASPQLNILTVGFIIKILLVLVLVGFALPVLPVVMDTLLAQVQATTRALAGG